MQRIGILGRGFVGNAIATVLGQPVAQPQQVVAAQSVGSELPTS